MAETPRPLFVPPGADLPQIVDLRQSPTALRVQRGVMRLLRDSYDFCCFTEVPLSNGRRADVLGLGPKGEIERHRLNIDPDAIRREKRPIFSELCRNGTVRFFPEARELVDLLWSAKKTLAIASGTMKSDIDAILENEGLLESFASVVGSDTAALKPDPESVVFAAITGVPPDLTPPGGAVDFDRVLSDARMQVRPQEKRPDRLEPACDAEGFGFATPARRVVETARGFGANGVVQSICQPSLTGAMRGITDRLARVIRSTRCVE